MLKYLSGLELQADGTTVAMEITLDEVRQKYISFLADEISPEEADRWAYSIIQEEELGNVIYIPSKEEGMIWSALMYLYGIDLQDKPGEYLHTKEDVREKLECILHEKR